jgi:hypothetical protein
MAKYRIKPKRDFGKLGFWIDGKWVRQGFVVTRDGGNCMPGATWFRTVADAFAGIRALEETGGGDAFWRRLRTQALAQ